MFAEYDRVRIKDKDVVGDIVELLREEDGTILYMVEADKEGPSGDPNAWDLRFPIYTCSEDQIEKI